MKKYIPWIAVIVAILIIGGFIYDKIHSGRISDRLQSELNLFRADNRRLKGRLNHAETIIDNLELSVASLESQNQELGDALSQSESLRGDLGAENKRLREILGDSTIVTEGIRKDSDTIGESLTEALEIVERYTEGD